ncbi:MAG: hypothetical protein U0231_08440 [Nitrospiraceae bacterium]
MSNSGRSGQAGQGISSGSLVELNGSDTTAGFNVSLLYTPFRNQDGKPLANIGLVHRSQATLHLTGNLLANGSLVSPTTATLVLPQVFSSGLAIWPIRNREREWKLELDVDYVGWKSNPKPIVHLTNGTVIPFPQNWQGAYTVMLGTEYRWLHLVSLPDGRWRFEPVDMNQQTKYRTERSIQVSSANSHVP